MHNSDEPYMNCYHCEHPKKLHKLTGEFKWGHDQTDCTGKADEYDDYKDGICHCNEFEYHIQQHTKRGTSRIHCVECGKICCYDDSSGGLNDTANDVKVYCPRCFKE